MSSIKRIIRNLITYVIGWLDRSDTGCSKYYLGCLQLRNKRESLEDRIKAYKDRKQRGFDISEVQEFGYTLDRYIIPRLRTYIDNYMTNERFTVPTMMMEYMKRNPDLSFEQALLGMRKDLEELLGALRVRLHQVENGYDGSDGSYEGVLGVIREHVWMLFFLRLLISNLPITWWLTQPTVDLFRSLGG